MRGEFSAHPTREHSPIMSPIIVVRAASANADLVNGNVSPPGRLNTGCGTWCSICFVSASSSFFSSWCLGGGLILLNRVAERLKVRRSGDRALGGVPKDVLGPARTFLRSKGYTLESVGRWRRRVGAASRVPGNIVVWVVNFRQQPRSVGRSVGRAKPTSIQHQQKLFYK